MSGSYFHQSNFSACDLSRANFTETEVQRAIFTGANLDGAKFKGAQYDRKTKWPGEPPPGAAAKA